MNLFYSDPSFTLYNGDALACLQTLNDESGDAVITDLLAITPEGCTVPDPFIGGGTTAVAALETGRKCVAVELSEEYAGLTMERAKQSLCPDQG